jgi:hypothetical protein
MDLLGKKYKFEDGNYIEVIQIKSGEFNGENTQIVTYNIGGPKDVPRKLVMDINQFVNNFGHLFQE